MSSLSSGVSLTVSTDDFESKMDAATNKLVKNLSKSQRALGMNVDELGRYVNAQGKCVEGLTLAQIRLGFYVDELGVVHTQNGGLVADLNKIEQALGFYANELGEVRNAQNEFVRLTNAAKKELADKEAAAEKAAAIAAAAAEKEAAAKERAEAVAALAAEREAERQARAVAEAERKKQLELERIERKENEVREAQQRRIQALGDSLGAVSQLTGQFAVLLATVQGTDESVGGFRSTLISFTESVSVGLGVFQSTWLAVNSLLTSLPKINGALATTASTSMVASSGLVSVGASASAASVGVKSLLATAAPAVAALLGVGSAVAAFAFSGHKGSKEIPKLADSFKELEERAKAAGDSIKGVADALKYGAFAAPMTELDKKTQALTDAQNKLTKAQKDYEEATRAQVEAAKYAGMGGSGYASPSKAGILAAEAAHKNALAEYNDVVAKMIDAAREEQKKESERLEEQIKAFEKIQEHAKDTEANEVIEKQISILTAKIEEAKEKEEKAAKETADTAAERAKEEKLKALGVLNYLKKAENASAAMGTTIAEFNQTVKKWGKSVESGELTQEELNGAVREYKKDVVARLGQDIGVDFSKLEAELGKVSPFGEIKKAFKEAAAQLGKNVGVDFSKLEAELGKTLPFGELKKTLKDAADRLGLDIGSGLSKLEAEFKKDSPFGELKKALDAKIISEREYEYGMRELFKKNIEASSTLEEYKVQLEALSEAHKNSAISEESYRELDELLKKKNAAALEQLTNARRAKAEQELSVDFRLLEKSAVERYADDLKQLEELRKDSSITLDEYNSALKQLKDHALLSLPGLEGLMNSTKAAVTAEEKYNEVKASLTKALEKNVISEQEHNDLLKKANKQKQAQLTQDMRSRLGVDALMESLKTPLVKYREAMKEIAAAAKARAISKQERAALENKAADEYWAAMNAEKKSTDAKGIGEKEKPTSSLSGGSESLYLAQVKNSTASYQNKIQTTTENLYRTSQEALYQSQQSNWYLQELVAANGGIPVFG